MEAAGIEPALENDTFATLFDQIPYTNATPPEACEELIDTFRSLSEQKQNTFLQRICEIYVKWAELPSAVRTAVAEWNLLPKNVRAAVAELLDETDEDLT